MAANISVPYKNIMLQNTVEEIDRIVYIEQWKDIVGFEGFYQISNFGVVKSVQRKVVGKNNCIMLLKGRVIKTAKNRKGYLVCGLSRDGRNKMMAVHRLVAIHFVLNPYNKPEVNHLDGNKLNNNAYNLEWATASENVLHAYKIGLKVPLNYWLGKKRSIEDREKFRISHLGHIPTEATRLKISKNNSNKRKVVQKDWSGNTIKIWDSIISASKASGVSYSRLCKCLDKSRNTKYEYQWEWYSV